MSGPRIWFTSDLHFGHRKVAEIRGFDDPSDHDRAIVEAWLSVVAPKDQVWVLGDIAISSPLMALSLLDKLPGEKHLIAGNHDRCHPMFRDAHRQQRKYLEVFASVQSVARRRIAGQDVIVSHFPYVGDTPGRDRDRHVEWRPTPDTEHPLPILHGHRHAPERVTELALGPYGVEEEWDHVKQIHVGLDAWDMQLVSMEQVAELLEGGE